MKYPGLGDPAKRKKTLRFLAITAIIAIPTIPTPDQIAYATPTGISSNVRDKK